MSISTNSIYDAVYASPIGKLGLKLDGTSISLLHRLPGSVRAAAPNSKTASEVFLHLDRYFTSACAFTGFSFAFSGTDFQQRVWHALLKIRAGEVLTYGALAKRLHTSSRAIGQACRTNPIIIMVPCHRVISAQGLGGYMGRSRQLGIKKWLLEHEGAKWRTTATH